MKQAENGDTNALNSLGSRYYWGQGGLPRDIPRALNYFRNAADNVKNF